MCSMHAAFMLARGVSRACSLHCSSFTRVGIYETVK